MVANSNDASQKINSSETYVEQKWTGFYNLNCPEPLQHVT